MLPHQQAAPVVDPPGVLKQRYVNAASLLAWGAYAALVYVVLVRGLQLARDTAFPLTIGKIGWGEISPPINIWFPLFPVAFALALLLPLATKYCIAFIVSIKGKDALSRWAKGILIVITGACIVSTLTATGPLMIESYSGKYREAAVAGEQIEANIRAKDAEIKAIKEQLAVLTEEGSKRPSIEAKAAREGAAGWPDKVKVAKAQAEAGQPIDLDRFERAQSAATSADAMRADIIKKIGEKAALPTASTAVTMVKSDESHGAQEFAEVSSAYWPMISFFALEMIAVFFGLIELVLMMTRDRQLADWAAVNAAPVPEAGIDTLAIEDFSNQTQVRPQKYSTNEKGEKMVWVHMGYYKDGTEKGYWRVLPGEKKRTQEEMDAAAAAKDAGKRNASDWYVKNETSMFDGLPEDGQNPQSEVSDVLEAEPIQAAAQSGNETLEAEGEGLEGDVGERDEEWGTPGGEDHGRASQRDGEQIVRSLDDELTHAQEDQQAHNSSDDPERDWQDGANAGNRTGQDVLYSGQSDAETEEEALDDAPLSSPDEQALWTEATETEEPANDGSETLLPDGEGVVVWDDETDPTIKELLRKTEAAE